MIWAGEPGASEFNIYCVWSEASRSNPCGAFVTDCRWLTSHIRRSGHLTATSCKMHGALTSEFSASKNSILPTTESVIVDFNRSQTRIETHLSMRMFRTARKMRNLRRKWIQWPPDRKCLYQRDTYCMRPIFESTNQETSLHISVQQTSRRSNLGRSQSFRLQVWSFDEVIPIVIDPVKCPAQTAPVLFNTAERHSPSAESMWPFLILLIISLYDI